MSTDLVQNKVLMYIANHALLVWLLISLLLHPVACVLGDVYLFSL